MYYASDGAPWKFERWKDITKVRFGLFPDDDDELPNGWTRDDAKYIYSYFQQFSRVSNKSKMSFSSAKTNGNQIPGRNLWRTWVTGIVKDAGIHRIIAQTLTDICLHPVTLSISSKNGHWPDGRTLLPLAIDPVGLALFGPEVLDAVGRIDMELREWTQAIIQRTWTNLHSQFNRSQKKIKKLEEQATQAFQSEIFLLSL